MIRAMIFDLDGTLVKTEWMKAVSYAQAAVELRPSELKEDEVIQAFKSFVGLPRRDVALGLMQRFGLEVAARERMEEFGVCTPWQSFVQVRLLHYESMLSDPQVLRDNQWSHNMALLSEAKRTGCKLGLATMSGCSQAQYILQVLNIVNDFDFIATRDDVNNGKPDPEIYLCSAAELDIPPRDCLVIEDSPSGVKAEEPTCCALPSPHR